MSFQNLDRNGSVDGEESFKFKMELRELENDKFEDEGKIKYILNNFVQMNSVILKHVPNMRIELTNQFN